MSPPVNCPRCGSTLGAKMEGGGERPACPAERFGFFHFGDASIGCEGVAIRDGKASLIQRGLSPGRGTWQIPGRYVEDDEAIPAAAEREVLEGAGVVAAAQEVPGFRHSASTSTSFSGWSWSRASRAGTAWGRWTSASSPWPNSRRRLERRADDWSTEAASTLSAYRSARRQPRIRG